MKQQTVFEKTDKARKLLLEATQLLNEVVEGAEGSEPDEWMQNRLEFWSRVLLAGGSLTEEKAHEIWEKEMGKDPRGYGGHFVGKQASLQKTHDGKIVLTMHAKDKCKAWTGMSLEEYAKKFKKK